MTSYAERFHAKYVKTAGCWLWVAGKDADGYGMFSLDGKPHRAHRVAWELAHGPIPDGLFVLHNCPDGDNPACVNPDHLWLGTNLENMADMVEKGRQATGDRNASRLYPERRPRGDAHRSRAEPSVMPRGEKNGSSKLKAEQVIAIRQAAGAGESHASIARRFGIVRSTVFDIARRRRWQHLDDAGADAELARRAQLARD